MYMDRICYTSFIVILDQFWITTINFITVQWKTLLDNNPRLMDINRKIIVISLLFAGTVLISCSADQNVPESTKVPPSVTPEPINPTKEPVPTRTPEAAIPTIEITIEEIPDIENEYDSADPNGQVISIWHPFMGDQDIALREIINDFNSSNLWGITVKPIYKEGLDKLDYEMIDESDVKPDLSVVNETQAAKFWLVDGLIDINPLVGHHDWGISAEELHHFYPGLIDKGIYPYLNGARLTFPIFGNLNVMYYNADWLVELGYVSPPERPETLKETACRATKEPFSGSTISGMKGLQISVSPSTYFDWARAFGSKVIYSGQEKFDLANPSTFNAMTFLQDIFNAKCAAEIDSTDGSINDFSQGGLLFSIDSTDKISEYRSSVKANADFNWRIAPLPHTTNSPATNPSVRSMGILKTTPHRQLAAWLFLKYFSDPHIQAAWVQRTGDLPVREDTSQYLDDSFIKNSAYQMAIDLLNYAPSSAPILGINEVQKLSLDALKAILTGSDIADTLDQLSLDANLVYDQMASLLPEEQDPWKSISPHGQTVTFWHPFGGDRQVFLEKIINEFNRNNEWDITVFQESKNGYGDLFLNMLAASGSGESPGILLAYQTHAAAYHQINGIIELSSLINNEKWGLSKVEKEDFFQGVYNQDIFPIYEWARLGFPFQRSTDVLYYNLDWLAELGFQDPPTQPEDFKKMACAADTPFSKALGENSQGYYFYIDSTRFSSWVFAFGGKLFNPDTNQFTYNDPSNIEVLDFFQDLIDSGCAIPISNRQTAQAAFSDGTLLFMVDSSYHISSIDNLVDKGSGFNWSISALPTKQEEPVQNIFGASMSIPRTTPETELAAWIFIKYLTGSDVQAQWVRNFPYLSVRRSAVDPLSEFFGSNPRSRIGYDLLDFGITEPSLPGYDLIRQDLELAIEAIFNGSEVGKTLDSLSANANKILAMQLEK